MSGRGGKSFGRGGARSNSDQRTETENVVFNRDFASNPEKDGESDPYLSITPVENQKKNTRKNEHKKDQNQKFHHNGAKNQQQSLDDNNNVLIPNPEDDPEFYSKPSNLRSGNRGSAVKNTIAVPPNAYSAFHLQPQHTQSHLSSGNDQSEQPATTTTTTTMTDKKDNNTKKQRSKGDKKDHHHKSNGGEDDKNIPTTTSSSRSKHSKNFNFNHIVPYDISNECMVCSHPIKVYAGSTCGHTDDLCGECIFKLRLFAKQTTSNPTFNPMTGEEEIVRATVVTKQEYLAQCEQEASFAGDGKGSSSATTDSQQQQSSTPVSVPTNSHAGTLSQLFANTISDPALDVDFISQSRSRDTVCLFCHVPITPLLLSKTPIKPSTYQLLILLHKLNASPKTSNLYIETRNEIYNLINITWQQAGLNKKTTISNFIETSFIYNSNLDIYTLPQDGLDFAETVENTASINCQRCVEKDDDQRRYTNNRTLTSRINDDFSVIYQTTPTIIPTIQHIALNVSLPGQPPSESTRPKPEPVTVAIGADLVPTDQYHEQTVNTPCTVTPLNYHHQSFSSLRQLNHHASHSHSLSICTACSGVSHDFISERSLYNHKDIILHGKKNQHSFCSLCRHQCYDNDELYAHLIDPANNHYMCRFCTTDTTVHQNELSQSGPIQAKKQTFKFFRNKAAYVVHMYHDHFVCDHPQCKQYDPNDTKNLTMSDPSRVQNPNKMIAFNNQFGLQQHQINAHHAKSKSGHSKKIDLTAMFTNTTSRTSTTISTSTTAGGIQPGYARTGGGTGVVAGANCPQIKDETGKVIKTTLDLDDIFVYSRVVQLSGDTQSAMLQMQALTPSESIGGGGVQRSGELNIHNLVQQPSQTDSRLDLSDRTQYHDLFPSLRGQEGGVKPSPSALPSFGSTGAGKASDKGKHPQQQQQHQKQELFPSFGSSKATSSGVVPPTASKIASNSGPTTVFSTGQSIPLSNVTPTTTVAKKNNLQDFINWNRSNPNQQLLKPSTQQTQKKPTVQHYYDYQDNTDGDIYTEAGYAYESVGNSKQSFMAAMGSSGLLNDKRSGNSENDRKALVGNKDVDFPVMLGAPVANVYVPGSKTAAQIADQGSKKKNKNKNQLLQPNAPSQPNAWGITVQPAQKQSKQPQQQPPPLSKPQSQHPAPKKVNNTVQTDTKSTNAKNTGLVLSTPILSIKPSTNTSHRNNYEQQLHQYTTKNLVSMSKVLNEIMSNPENKGKRAPLVDKYLFSNLYGSETTTTVDEVKPTEFEIIIEHIRTLDLPKSLPGYNTLMFFQTLIATTLANVLSTAHKKALSLFIHQLSIIMQSLCSDETTTNDCTIENFYTNSRLQSLVPQGPAWKSISAAITQLNQKYPPQSTCLPQLLQYPGLDGLGVIGDKNKTLLFSTLNNSSTTTAQLNKTLVPLVNDGMSLSRRVILYTYLQAYLKMFLCKPGNFQKLINHFLRSADAQEMM